MRLVYLTDSRIPSRSTSAMQVMRMCSAFQRAGADVTLLCPRYKAPRPEGYDGALWSYYGIRTPFRLVQPHVAIPYQSGRVNPLLRLWRMAQTSWHLARLLKQADGHVTLYGRSLSGLWAADLLRRVPGLRNRSAGLFVELHDVPRSRTARHFLARADGVVTITKALAARIVETTRLNPHRIWIEPDGTDLTQFEVTPDLQYLQRTTICTRLGLTPSQPIIVYAGRINREKGSQVLLSLPRLLKDSGCQFIYLGKVYDPEYAARVAESQLDNVRLLGFVPPSQVPEYLLAADVLLLPSTSALSYAEYMSPLKLFEYMAAGRPIVASDLPVFREILDPDKSALLVPPADASAWAGAISRLLKDRALGQRLAMHARQIVENHTWDERARRILTYMHTPSAA